MIEQSDFRGMAAAAIGTPPVAAVEDGARRLARKRMAATELYAPMEAMRDRARQIRLHTLANLDRYLEQFVDAAERNGTSVHFAANDIEARALVIRIAQDHDVRTIVKSKSMVTEEIHLNPALEAAGLEVVETDLGEFIIQIADDRPSHIIAPVLHRTRFEVGELFSSELGVAYTDEPTELNAIARSHLRRIFLAADMGISGVNFGVAETGSVTLVTNEGNGRLTTTAPRVHVAVMGMERLVPSVTDLAVMLEVLARSATGQALSVYTNVTTGPRRPGDADGPDDVHIVIVDNGRTDVLAGDMTEILACIRCGACLNICPVYRHAGGHAYGTTYSGPVGAVLNPALMGQSAWGELAHASSLCGACQEVCPIRIDIPGLLVKSRAEGVAEGTAGRQVAAGIKAYAAAATRPSAFRALLKTGGLLGSTRKDGFISSLPFMGKGWTETRDLRAPARRSFHDRWKDRNGA